MADTNLARLRTRLRLIVNPPGRTPLTDDELDEFLQANRTLVSDERLKTPNNKLFQSSSDMYDLAASLADSAGTTLTADTADPLAGVWTFNTSRGSVYLTGYSYDLYGAGAMAWEYLIGAEADKFDATVDGATYYQSQVYKAYTARRDYCVARMRSTSAEAYRDYR